MELEKVYTSKFYNLGYSYQHGIEAENDKRRAFENYWKAAETGHDLGIFSVGYCYHHGIGVEKDKYKAFKYYKKSSDAGLAEGTYMVGYCYRYGIGVIKEERNAFPYFQRAALNGVYGQFCVGRCYKPDYYAKPLNYLDSGMIDALSAIALSNRGMAYSRMGRYEESLADLNKALEIDPSNAMAFNNRGTNYMRMDKYEESLADFNRALEIDPNHMLALCNRSETYYHFGRYEESLVDLNKSLNIDPNYLLALINRGKVYLEIAKHDESFADLNLALEIDPFNTTALINRGSAYRSTGEYDKALADINKALDINPNNAAALCNRGEIYSQIFGSYEKSLADLNKALEIKPNNKVILNNRGLTFRQIGRSEESFADLNKSIEIDPNYAAALSNRGLTINEWSGNFDPISIFKESLADLNKSLEIEPNNLFALTNRGTIYYSLYIFEELLAIQIKILNTDPNKLLDLNKLLEFSKLNIHQQLAELDKLDPDNVSTLNNRGPNCDIFIKLALADLNKVLEIDPSHTAALNARGEIYQKMGRHKESLSDLNKSFGSFGMKSNNTCMDYLEFGTCSNCGEFNTGFFYCHSCESKISQDWTSGDSEIDEFIKVSQKNSKYYNKVIEFIPYDKLKDVKKIGEGGFGTVYSATWTDGKRTYVKDKFIGPNYKLLLSRKQCTVALKSLGFFDEFKIHYECQLNRYSVDKYGIEIYGITYNPDKKEYLMVFEYADKGDLRQYLSTNFKTLDWQQKIKILCSISDNLNNIHQSYIHGDFHSGNILMISTKSIDNIPYLIGDKLAVISLNIGDKITVEPKISDLGLSRKINEPNTKEVPVYGVVSYLAPEVLFGNQHTKESDIFSLGVIMSVMSTGKPPFENISHNTIDFRLAIKDGLRPEFAQGTPDVYIELAKQCMDDDPKKRPTAKEVYEQLQEWEIILCKKQEEINKEQINIKNKFLEADKIIPTLSTISQKHQDDIYTCQSISKLSIFGASEQTNDLEIIDASELTNDEASELTNNLDILLQAQKNFDIGT